MKKMTVFVTAMFLFAAQFTMAAEPHFLRVEVQEFSNDADPTQVSLNLPMSTLRAMTPQIENAVNEGLENAEVDGQHIDLRAIWAEIQAVGPHEYARINGPEGDVVVSTTATHLVIEAADSEDDFVARIPLSVGDIVLGAEEIDFEAVVNQLIELEETYLIEVTGSKINMRAWIE